MKKLQFRSLAAAALSSALLFPSYLNAAGVDDVLKGNSATAKQNVASQTRIDKNADVTRDKLQQFKQELKIVEDLRVYNRKLEIQVQRQNERLAQIEQSISDVTVIQRQVMPLLIRMIDGLEQFIELDIPFLIDERRQRISFLRGNLDRSDLTIAEKFRQVLEAYKIENEYGRKMESYKSSINLNGLDREVTMLRVGRAALVYQTTDGVNSGMWDKAQGQFVALGDDYRSAVLKGIRIARKQASIDLINLPISAPEAL